jgi:hypothetical protein
MKRNLIITIVFGVGVLVGGLPSRPMRTLAQDQKGYKYVSPAEAKNIKEFTAAKQRHNELTLKSEQIKAEALDGFQRTISSAAAEKDPEKRATLLRVAENYQRIAQDAGIGEVYVYRADLVSSGGDTQTRFIPEHEIVGFACTATSGGGTKCFVASR